MATSFTYDVRTNVLLCYYSRFGRPTTLDSAEREFGGSCGSNTPLCSPPCPQREKCAHKFGSSRLFLDNQGRWRHRHHLDAWRTVRIENHCFVSAQVRERRPYGRRAATLRQLQCSSQKFCSIVFLKRYRTCLASYTRTKFTAR